MTHNIFYAYFISKIILKIIIFHMTHNKFCVCFLSKIILKIIDTFSSPYKPWTCIITCHFKYLGRSYDIAGEISR